MQTRQQLLDFSHLCFEDGLNFGKQDLQGASFHHVDVSKLRFEGSNLAQADFSLCIGLTTEQLSEAASAEMAIPSRLSLI